MHVLVIDDDSRLRQVLARWLRDSGFSTVAEAADGLEALDLLNSHPPDLILTDRDMPRMDGLGFVKILRSRGDRTPIIMLSGHDDPHTLVLAARAGVDSFLTKPISLEMLSEKILQVTVKC